jgi:hypothetical protein
MKKVCLSREGEVDLCLDESLELAGCLYLGDVGTVTKEWSARDGSRFVDVKANGEETTYSAEYVREA